MHQTVAFSKHYTTHLLFCSSVTRTPTLIIWCFFSSGTSVSAFIAFNTWQLFQEWNIGSAKYTPILPVYHLDILLCIYIYMYIHINFIYTQSLQIQNGIVMDWLYPSPVLEGPNCGIETGTTQEAIIQSSLSSPFLRPCYKDHTGKTKKRFTKLQALVNHLRSLIDASPFVWSI